ncbi:MAG: hypothetical protein AABZ60_03725 [Planctomycetota bacterium]
MKSPSFLKVGQRYNFAFEGGAWNATLLEILEDGWLKLDSPSNPTYLNLTFIRSIHAPK